MEYQEEKEEDPLPIPSEYEIIEAPDQDGDEDVTSGAAVSERKDQHQSRDISKSDKSSPFIALSPTHPPPPRPPSSAVHFDLSSLTAAAHNAISGSDSEYIVSQFLVLLETHREECERKSMYVEAEQTKEKIVELREHIETKLRSSLSTRHATERADLDAAHLHEFDAFNTYWSVSIFAEFDQRTKEKQHEMAVRHVEALEQWTKEEEKRMLLRPKFSKALLELRSQQEAYAKARNYKQAELLKTKANHFEQIELHQLRVKWNETILARREKFLSTQKQELDSFLYRRKEERAMLQHKKLTELRDKIVQKYKNLKMELEVQQTKERMRAERQQELGISASSFLREQVPKNRNYVASLPVDCGNTTNGATAAATAKSSSQHGSRLHSSHAQRRRRIEDEEEAMLREGEAELGAVSLEHVNGTAAEIPTISDAINERPMTSSNGAPRKTVPSAHQLRPSTGHNGASLPSSAAIISSSTASSSRPKSRMHQVNNSTEPIHASPVTNGHAVATSTNGRRASNSSTSRTQPIYSSASSGHNQQQQHTAPIAPSSILTQYQRPKSLPSITKSSTANRSHRIVSTSNARRPGRRQAESSDEEW